VLVADTGEWQHSQMSNDFRVQPNIFSGKGRWHLQ
jgi:hypothetical protein